MGKDKQINRKQKQQKDTNNDNNFVRGNVRLGEG